MLTADTTGLLNINRTFLCTAKWPNVSRLRIVLRFQSHWFAHGHAKQMLIIPAGTLVEKDMVYGKIIWLSFIFHSPTKSVDSHLSFSGYRHPNATRETLWPLCQAWHNEMIRLKIDRNAFQPYLPNTVLEPSGGTCFSHLSPIPIISSLASTVHDILVYVLLSCRPDRIGRHFDVFQPDYLNKNLDLNGIKANHAKIPFASLYHLPKSDEGCTRIFRPMIFLVRLFHSKLRWNRTNNYGPRGHQATAAMSPSRQRIFWCLLRTRARQNPVSAPIIDKMISLKRAKPVDLGCVTIEVTRNQYSQYGSWMGRWCIIST